MDNILNRIENLGIDADTPIEEKKIIKTINRLSIIALITVNLPIALCFSSNNVFWGLLASIFLYPLFSAPLVFNYYKKIKESRLLFVLYLLPALVFLAFLFPKECHFQYIISVVVGVQLLIGKNIPHAYKVFPLLGVLSWVFLEWYYTYYSALLSMSAFNKHAMYLLNNASILWSSITIYYTIIQERDVAIEQIKQKSLELEQKNIQLEHFAHIASHDLNEPLRTIHSFVDIIKEDCKQSINHELQTYLDFIQEALDRMRAMIDGLLNYSRIGKLSALESVNINHLLHSLQEDLSYLIRDNRAIINLESLPTLYCSKLEIRHLFQHLITNAIKFQKPNTVPTITISCVEQDQDWLFCVTDNGIGIRKGKQQEIFNIFTKLHRNIEYKGQGIGLSFCKKIVELHQGKIWVESTLNQGCQFCFTISKNLSLATKI
jgi:signal transduction histidine kinase